MHIFLPDMYQSDVSSFANCQADPNFTRLDAEFFQCCLSESTDCAGVEKSLDALIVRLDGGWNDYGSLTSLRFVGDEDPADDLTVGEGILCGTKSSYLRADGQRVALVGVEDLVIVSLRRF